MKKLLFLLSGLLLSIVSQAQLLHQAEYFFDTDPGLGQGTPITFSPVDSISLDSIVINTPGLTLGYHYLYARAQNSEGVWGLTNRQRVYIYDYLPNPVVSSPLVGGEYFFDQDSLGPGSGVPFSFAAGDSIALDLLANTPNLDTGQHILFVRVKDSLGFWSFPQSTTFDVCSTYSPLAGFDYIRYGNKISILDSSVFAQDYSWDFGDGTMEDTISHPLHTFELPGTYSITQIVSNECGIDSFSQILRLTGISNYFPKSGGLGDITMNLYGAGFTDSSIVSLRLQGNPPIFPSEIHISSPGNMIALFDLRTQPFGDYDLWVELEDTLQVFEEGFHLAAPSLLLHSQIIGQSAIRPNIPATFFITVENTGNIDAVGVPLWIALSPEVNVSFDLTLVYPHDSVGIPIDSVPEFIAVDSLSGKNYPANVYAFLIPYVPARSTIHLPATISTSSPGPVRLLSWVDEPLYGSPLSNDQVQCIKGIIEEATNLTPQTACIYGVLDLAFSPLYDAVFAPERLEDAGKYATNYLIGMTGVSLECLNASNPLGTTASIVKRILEFRNTVNVVSDCFDAFIPPLNPDDQDVEVSVINSFDPNEKIGTVGVGTEKYISQRNQIQYSVFFENVDTATGSAQIVHIIDTLDQNVFNINTFELGPITIADTFLIPPGGLKEWTEQLPMPNSPLILRINCRLDSLAGVITWSFLSLDSASLEITSNPFLGFLPPNILPPAGEGKVTFLVQLKDSVTDGAIIANQASIFFDFNDPILTNVWSNTLDLTTPQSSMNPLPLISVDTLIELSWGGTDLGSGITSYDIFLSQGNDTSFTKWQSLTQSTSDTLAVQIGESYRFYSIAYDGVGNVEMKGATVEATTTITESSTSIDNWYLSSKVHIYPNPATSLINLDATIPNQTKLEVKINSLMGQEIRSYTFYPNIENRVIEKIDFSDFASGVYIIRIISDSGVEITRKLMKR